MRRTGRAATSIVARVLVFSMVGSSDVSRVADAVSHVQGSTVRDGVLLLIVFEVTPSEGGAPFLDEEVLPMRPESAEKLIPGNVVRARYGRGRVFPTSPVTVVSTAAAA